MSWRPQTWRARSSPGSLQALVDGWPDGTPAAFHLQGGPAASTIKAGPRILLGISIEGAIQANALAPTVGMGSRVDAAIVPPHGGLLAIETKVVDFLDLNQLGRHRKLWKIPTGHVNPARWVHVWEWARAEHQAATDAVARFLLQQFCEYLEIRGFGRWAGFREEDFEQFLEWNWEHQPILRARMRAAWERVLELMPTTDADRLKPIEAGKLPRSAETAWAQTNRGQPGVNLTLQLGAFELQMNMVGWKAAQASRFAKWLISTPERVPDLDLIVYERRPTPDHKGKPYWMRENLAELKRFSPDKVRSGAFARWERAWQKKADLRWQRLGYQLRRTWTREQVLHRAADLADDIAALASQAIPLLQDINA